MEACHQKAQALWKVYSCIADLLHKLSGAASGQSASEIIHNPTFVSRVEENIQYAQTDSRTSAALGPIMGAYQDIKMERAEFDAGAASGNVDAARPHYERGNEHLKEANAKLDKASKAADILRVVIETAIRQLQMRVVLAPQKPKEDTRKKHRVTVQV